MQHPFHYLFRCFLNFSVFSVCCLAEQQPDSVHVEYIGQDMSFIESTGRISPFVFSFVPRCQATLRIAEVNFNAGADSKF